MNKIENVLVTRRYIVTGAKRVSNYWWAFIVSFGGFAFLLTGFASFLQRGIFLFNQSKIGTYKNVGPVDGANTFVTSGAISFFPQGLIMCFYGCLGLLFGFYLWCTIFWKVGDGFNEFNQNEGLVRIFRWGLPGKNRRIDFQYQINEIEGVRVELKEGINPRRIISLKMKASSKRASSPAIKNKQVKKDTRSLNQTETPGGDTVFVISGASRQNSIENVKEPVLRSKSSKSFNEKKSQKDNRAKASLLQAGGKTGVEAFTRPAFIVPLTRVGQPISLEKIESQASELAQFLRVSLETAYLDS